MKNLFKIFWLQNKRIIISLMLVYLFVIISYIFVVVIQYQTQIYEINRYMLMISEFFYFVMFIFTFILPGALFFNNLIGKKRKIVIKYYGKRTFLKYSLFLNFLLFLNIIILVIVVGTLHNISNNLDTNLSFYTEATEATVIYTEADGEAAYEPENLEEQSVKDQTLLQLADFEETYMALSYLIYYYLICTGVFYSCILTFNNLYFHSKYKYSKKKVKIYVIGKKLLTYIIFAIFIMMIPIIKDFDIFNYNYEVVAVLSDYGYINFGNLFLNLVIVLIYIVILIEYIRIYNDETFL